MSLQEVFRADCILWNGYKPCAIQKADNRPDCLGCAQHVAGPVVYDIESMPFRPEMLTEAKNIGIIEMGGLGSVLRTTAVTRAIREVNPHIDIAWFTHHRGAELLKYVPGVTAVDVETTDAAEQTEIIKALDALINFEFADPAKSLVAQARCIGGFALNAQGRFYGVYPHAAYFQRLQVDDAFRKQNTLTMQQILLRSIGLERYEAQYDVSLTTANYRQADQILGRAFNSQHPAGLIGLNIGTSEKGRLRRWPAERHAALAQIIANAHPDKGIAILSGPQDDETRSRMLSSVVDLTNIAVLPNNLEVGDFIALLSRLQVVVTSDTFGMHAARSQNVSIVALAGPMPHQELELSPQDRLIGPMLDCAPCYHKCRRFVAGQCMLDISPEHVAGEVDRILSLQGA